ncbi:MAG: YggS family pyridoxal phosphate-dependent enzyme [Campylobacterales bacterium]
MTNLESVIDRIEKARLSYNNKAIIKLVAASKYVDAEAIKKLYLEGQRAFGENKIQDMRAKKLSLDELPIEWHFIGRIQTNKINMMLEANPFLVHSIDSYEMALEIDKRAKVKNMQINALLQINSAKEETKAGVDPEVASDEYRKIIQNLPNINLKGVMTIGAHSEEKKDIQKSFEGCRKIFDELEKEGAKICSMGMSSDFELAIASGSNMLRVGSILFS